MRYTFYKATNDKNQWAFLETKEMPYCQDDGATVQEWAQYHARQYAHELSGKYNCCIRFQPEYQNDKAVYTW